jgi:hypothetical protein
VRLRIAVLGIAIVVGGGLAEAQTGVELVGQERRLDAFAYVISPAEPQHQVSGDTGAFSGRLNPHDVWVSCVVKCISLSAGAVAEQESTINFNTGVLDIRGNGSVSTSTLGAAGATSALSVVFRTLEPVPYLLRVELTGAASLELTNEDGVVISHQNFTGILEEDGVLVPSKTYTLTIQSATAALGSTGAFRIRFTTGESFSDLTRCTVGLNGRLFSYGDVVSATDLRITNSHAADVPIELKVWLRLPNGNHLSAWNTGADGTLVFPAGRSKNFAPFDILGVGDDVATGDYEFGCRLLDPSSGRELYQSSATFSVN